MLLPDYGSYYVILPQDIAAHISSPSKGAPTCFAWSLICGAQIAHHNDAGSGVTERTMQHQGLGKNTTQTENIGVSSIQRKINLNKSQESPCSRFDCPN